MEPAPVGLREMTSGELARARLLGTLVRRIRDLLERGGPRLSADEVRELGAYDRLLGRAVGWSEGPGGIARGVAPDGSLQLATADGKVHVRSGSVRPIARDTGDGDGNTNTQGEGT